MRKGKQGAPSVLCSRWRRSNASLTDARVNEKSISISLAQSETQEAMEAATSEVVRKSESCEAANH